MSDTTICLEKPRRGWPQLSRCMANAFISLAQHPGDLLQPGLCSGVTHTYRVTVRDQVLKGETFHFFLQTLPSKEAFLNSTQTPYMGSPLSWDNWEQSSKSQLLREHVSKLDSSFHPVLSLPSGKLPHETWNISYNKNITFKYRQSLKNVWSFIFGGGGIVEMGPHHVALELFMYTKHTGYF